MRVTRDLSIPLSEVQVRASRSSGPGGQHANVTASRIEASFDVAGSRSLTDAQRERLLSRVGPRVTAVAQDARSQARNLVRFNDKGSKVAVSGRIRSDFYNPDGVPNGGQLRSAVVADRIEYLTQRTATATPVADEPTAKVAGGRR